MVENSILKSVGLLALILIGVLTGTYEVAEFFLKEKEFRKFWLKVWLFVSVVIGVFFWLVLLFSGK